MATAISCFFWFQSSDGSSETSTDQEHVGVCWPGRISHLSVWNPESHPLLWWWAVTTLFVPFVSSWKTFVAAYSAFEAWSALVYVLLLYLKFHAPLFQSTRYLWTFGEGRGRSIWKPLSCVCSGKMMVLRRFPEVFLFYGVLVSNQTETIQFIMVLWKPSVPLLQD